MENEVALAQTHTKCRSHSAQRNALQVHLMISLTQGNTRPSSATENSVPDVWPKGCPVPLPGKAI